MIQFELQTIVQRFFAGEPVVWNRELLEMAILFVQRRMKDASREDVLDAILGYSTPVGHA